MKFDKTTFAGNAFTAGMTYEVREEVSETPIFNFNDLPRDIKMAVSNPDSFSLEGRALQASSFLNQDSANSIILAQTTSDQAASDQANPVQDPNLATDEGAEPLPFLSQAGNGGLSVVTTVGLNRSLTHEALPGETTASSGESHTGFVTELDGQTIDGLHGIPYLNKDFRFPPIKVPELAVAFSVEDSVPTPAATLAAINDFNTVTIESRIIDSENPIALSYAPATGNILSNDSDPNGSPISLISFNNQLFSSISLNGTWTFSITDGGVADSGQIAGGWTLNFSTATNPIAYSFSNFDLIPIDDNSTSLSNITVSGINQPITNLTLTLHDMHHGFFGDLTANLTSSTGQTIELFDHINGNSDINGYLAFDDLASTNVNGSSSSVYTDQTLTTQSGHDLISLVSVVAQGNYGTFYAQSNGHYIYETDITNPAVNSAIVNNQPNSFTDSVSYTIANSQGSTDSANLSVTTDVLARTNLPPVAHDDFNSITGQFSGGPGEISFPSLSENALNNDTDADENGFLALASIAGQAVGSSPVSINGLYGTLLINPNGFYTYDADEANAAVQNIIQQNTGGTLTESFEYTVVDSLGATDTGNLNISIVIPDNNIVPV